MLMKTEKKKKRKGLWYSLFIMMMIGAIGASMTQTKLNGTEKYMHRILRGVRDEYEYVELYDVECSAFSCIGVEGVEIVIPELGKGERIWIYKYMDKNIVTHSANYYKQVNNLPGTTQVHYYAHGNFFITGTTGISYDEFKKIIDMIIEEM